MHGVIPEMTITLIRLRNAVKRNVWHHSQFVSYVRSNKPWTKTNIYTATRNNTRIWLSAIIVGTKRPILTYSSSSCSKFGPADGAVMKMMEAKIITAGFSFPVINTLSHLVTCNADTLCCHTVLAAV